jgi:hypothetical protein
MSVLRSALTPPNTAGSPLDENELEYLGSFFWSWYAQHSQDKIATIKFLFINVTIRVYHVKTLFVLLFGPEPLEG